MLLLVVRVVVGQPAQGRSPALNRPLAVQLTGECLDHDDIVPVPFAARNSRRRSREEHPEHLPAALLIHSLDGETRVRDGSVEV